MHLIAHDLKDAMPENLRDVAIRSNHGDGVVSTNLGSDSISQKFSMWDYRNEIDYTCEYFLDTKVLEFRLDKKTLF